MCIMTGSKRFTLLGNLDMGKPVDVKNFLLTLWYLETFHIKFKTKFNDNFFRIS